jgi:hypothetical protein
MRTASETPQWALLSLCAQSGQVAVDNYAGGEVAFIQSLTSGELRRLPGMLGGYRRHRGTLGGIML